jgi:hypothetical protein
VPVPRSVILKVLAAAALALPVAGCGSSDKGLLNKKQSKALSQIVDNAQNATDKTRCSNISTQANEGVARVQRMQSLDPDLRQNLVEGFQHLDETAQTDCAKTTPTPTETPTATATVAPPTPTPTETATTPTPTPSPTPTATTTEVPTVTVVPTETPTTGLGGAQPTETP